MNRETRTRIFCRELWKWYATNKRALPWRDLKLRNRNQRAYLIWISEVMLQQTQVSRVIPAFKRFIAEFPTLQLLAEASNREALIAWRGMGYNSRALRLRDGARMIVETFGGRFPDSVEDLRSIKGIGEYTAGAIRNFAFGIPTPCIDTNIRRILHRFFVGPEHSDGTWKRDDRYLLKIADEVLQTAIRPSSRPASAGHPSPRNRGEGSGVRADAWHSALMDFGALVCKKNNPRWGLFSKDMKSVCKAYGSKINRTKNLNNSARDVSREPGRLVAGRFIPNRIFRGKIVEALRDHPKGLTSRALGARIAIDWSMRFHKDWLQGLVSGLKRDGLIRVTAGRFVLSD